MATPTTIITMYASHLFQDTSKNMFNKIWDLVHEKHDFVKEVMESLDLISKVELAESIVRDMNQEMKENHVTMNHTLELALTQLSDIISQIHEFMKKLKEGVEFHKTLWFSWLRTPEYLTILDKLKIDKIILDERIDNLIKVITLFKESNIK